MESSIERVHEPMSLGLAIPNAKVETMSPALSLELMKYDKVVVKKFLKKYGSFSKSDALTNKEHKMLRKIAYLTEKKSESDMIKKKKRKARNRMEKRMSESNCNQRIAFDLSYFNEDILCHDEMKICMKQIQQCYSANRKMTEPLQLHITSVKGKPDEILSNNMGYRKWDVHFHDNSYLEIFKREEIVYLTNDSENIIDRLDDSKVYIVGGLIPNNSCNNIPYKRAIANNISHGRLPIGINENVGTQQVLPINQVYSILASVACGKPWSEAYLNSVLQKEKCLLNGDKMLGEMKDSTYSAKRKMEKKMTDSNCKQRIAFDLSYFSEGVMRYVDMRMCIKQIQRCYSENRKLSEPLQFYITSIRGKPDEILSHNMGYRNWDVHFHDNSYLDVFEKEEIVYLTSESENIIDTLDDSKVYVIGGLLDHNSLKGLSYNRAIENNISHGRLPIDKYMNMKTLKVLPINQVYSILALVANGKSWPEALITILPQRKEATPKLSHNNDRKMVTEPILNNSSYL